MVGWGSYRGGFGTCGPNNYRVHEVEILDKTQCDMYYGKGTMTERMLCVRPRNQGTRSCLGDTGGWFPSLLASFLACFLPCLLPSFLPSIHLSSLYFFPPIYRPSGMRDSRGMDTSGCYDLGFGMHNNPQIRDLHRRS